MNDVEYRLGFREAAQRKMTFLPASGAHLKEKGVDSQFQVTASRETWSREARGSAWPSRAGSWGFYW